MNQLKDMYRTLVDDGFPDSIQLGFGSSTLVYRRRSWRIGGTDKGLRYGENPGQPAALYALTNGTVQIGGIVYRGPEAGLLSAVSEEQMLQAGKHPGKTNLTDVDSGIAILQHLHTRPACVILKHNNPCGAAWSVNSLAEATAAAYWADRLAAFGGVLLVNRRFDEACAESVEEAYLEVVAAPDYSEDALKILRKKKNLRILQLPGLAVLERFLELPYLDIRSLSDGGLIIQQSPLSLIRSPADFLPAQADCEGTTVLARAPDEREADDLFFAWAVCSQVVSNAVVFAKNGCTVAIGAGQQDRVGCVDLAVRKAYAKYADMLVYKKHGRSWYELGLMAEQDPELSAFLGETQETTALACGGLKRAVMASDGFFPFRDGVDLAVREGISAIAQPGGSLRDCEVIEAVNEAAPQVAMVFTGQRVFKH